MERAYAGYPLHEIAHYFGFEEDDMVRLGLQ